MYFKCDCDVNAISQHVTLKYLSINHTSKQNRTVSNTQDVIQAQSIQPNLSNYYQML